MSYLENLSKANPGELTIKGLSHLVRARKNLEQGKEEIAQTHFQEGVDDLVDALVAAYPDVAYQSGDFQRIEQERESRRKKVEFVVKE